MTEEWRPVVGYEGLYEVSNTGQVRSVGRYYVNSLGKRFFLKGKILSLSDNGRGYLRTNLTKDKKTTAKYIHRLVAEAFILNVDGLPAVNHKDEDKTNNSVENLEWCDNKYNDNYGTRNKRVIETKIEKGILDPELCYLSKKEYKRLAMRKYREKNKEKMIEYHREYSRKYNEKNREKMREYWREYSRKYRAKKREESIIL